MLDDGEASCLAVAMMRQAVLLTDDFQARRLAKQEEIQISGTIGLLLMLVRSEHITLREANIMLSEMIQHGYRSPVSNLNAFLD